jgi:hypothetical protein
MSHLRLYPTSMAQWHALVQDAEKLLGCRLDEELQSYLVLLLQRFIDKPEVAHGIAALEYLENCQQHGVKRQTNLRDLGDKCLLFSGLYPQLSVRRRVPITYYIELGQQSYHLLSVLDHTKLAQLFHALEQHFVVLMDTLQCMRELAGEEDSISLLQAEELWREKHSKHALDILRRHTHNSLPIAGNNSKRILH